MGVHDPKTEVSGRLTTKQMFESELPDHTGAKGRLYAYGNGAEDVNMAFATWKA